jgi:hypothetical protein
MLIIAHQPSAITTDSFNCVPLHIIRHISIRALNRIEDSLWSLKDRYSSEVSQCSVLIVDKNP